MRRVQYAQNVTEITLWNHTRSSLTNTYEALERMHSRSSEQVMRDFERHC